MTNPARRAGLYLLGTAVVMVVYALLYQYGMSTLEGQPVSFIEAMSLVVQTFTTVGYGDQAGQWNTDLMLVLTMLMELTGVVLIFLTLPAFVLPLFEEALSSGPSTQFDGSDHVVVCEFSPTVETLVEEFQTREKPYVVVEPVRGRAVELEDEGFRVVHGDPEDVDTMEAVSLSDADALVAAGDDETNASIILAARSVDSEVPVVSLVENEAVSDYHRYAGADDVIQPRRLLGESLASKASSAVSKDLGDAVEIDEDLDIAELLVQRASPIEGRTIADCGVADFPGTNVIGAWFRGEFVSPPDPDHVVDEHTILLVAGPPEGVEQMKELTLSETRRHRRGTVIVAGYGVVGSSVAEAVSRTGLPTKVIDLHNRGGVDVVGDITDPRTLEEADLVSARSLVLCVEDDTTALFAALVARQVDPSIEVIARANDADSVPKLYRAGAEYVLALPTVSGRMLASKLLDEEVITPETQVELVRMAAPKLVGQTLAEADVRARTSCTVVAVKRDGELLTGIGPEFVVQKGDTLVVAGNDEAIDRFANLVS
jgi:Trk K+ transport system NAD-binding subunit